MHAWTTGFRRTASATWVLGVTIVVPLVLLDHLRHVLSHGLVFLS